MEILKRTKCAGKVHYASSRYVLGMQNSSAQCGRGEQQLWCGGRTTPGFGLSPYLFLLLMDVLTQDVRKDIPGSMMFADDIVLCGDDRVLGDLEEGIRGERDEEQQTKNLIHGL